MAAIREMEAVGIGTSPGEGHQLGQAAGDSLIESLHGLRDGLDEGARDEALTKGRERFLAQAAEYREKR